MWLVITKIWASVDVLQIQAYDTDNYAIISLKLR